MVEEKKTESWVSEQKKEDIFEEIIYKSKHINLTHLRRVGWNGFPVSFFIIDAQNHYDCIYFEPTHIINFSHRIDCEHRVGNCYCSIYQHHHLNRDRHYAGKEMSIINIS
jgi:hypothetical protein